MHQMEFLHPQASHRATSGLHDAEIASEVLLDAYLKILISLFRHRWDVYSIAPSTECKSYFIFL